jgi:hypothetical protein
MNMIRNTVARKSAWLSTIALVAAMHLGESALAQATSRPPDRMTYQGFIAGSDGVALGNTAPKNYDVIFRIFDSETGGIPLWGEQQTVTVDAGLFSVLLGEGSAVNGTPNAGITLSTLFNGGTASDRYVGITIKGIGSGGTDVDVMPRMRLLSSPYAFLASRSLSSQTAVKLVQDNVGAADLLTSSGNMVNINGSLSIEGSGALVLGAGDPSKGDSLNGRIGYALQTPGSLDVIGTGATHADRRIQFVAEGGSTFNGPINAASLSITGAISAATLSLSGQFSAANVTATHVTSTTNTVNSELRVASGARIDLGAGLTKGQDNGTISYSRFGTDRDLEIVGGGSGISDRRISFFNQGIAYFNGPVGINAGNPGMSITTTSGTTPVDLDVLNIIQTKQRVYALGYANNSDRRIKSVIRLADANDDIDKLRRIRVTDYREIQRGETQRGIKKGVLAQEVREVLPDAVSTSSGIIPYLNQTAVQLESHGRAGIVKARFNIPHGLKDSQRFEALADGAARSLSVDEVVDEMTICIKGLAAVPSVLRVTGKETEDFLSVDYNQIFMTAVSALQEVERRLVEVERRESRIEVLERKAARVEELEKRAVMWDQLEAQAARLQALEGKLAELQQVVLKHSERDGRSRSAANATDSNPTSVASSR